MIALIVMTDGRRDCIERAIASHHNLDGGLITRRIISDDSGDVGYQMWLLKTFPQYDLWSAHERQGFGGAYASAWLGLSNLPERYVFSTEDDFTIDRPVDMWGMVYALNYHAHLVQIALRRQAWNDSEKAAGGVVEQHPEDYEEITDGRHEWLEHRRFFTTNPSLFRRELCEKGWPNVPQSEGMFTQSLLPDPLVRFGYWGSRDSGVWTTHIGEQRVGTGY